MARSAQGKKILGVTLIELLAVLSLFFILLISSAPSFHYFILENNKNLSLTYLKNAFAFAQAEAVFKNRKIMLCGSSDNKICNGNWSANQLVLDEKTNIIRHYHFAFEGQLRLFSSFGHDEAITFLPNGWLADQGHFEWSLKNKHYLFYFLRSGRFRVE